MEFFLVKVCLLKREKQIRFITQIGLLFLNDKINHQFKKEIKTNLFF